VFCGFFPFLLFDAHRISQTPWEPSSPSIKAGPMTACQGTWRKGYSCGGRERPSTARRTLQRADVGPEVVCGPEVDLARVLAVVCADESAVGGGPQAHS